MSFREFTSKFAGGRGNPPLQHSRAHPLFIMQLFPCRPLRVVILRQQPKNLVSHLLHFALFEILRFAQDDKLFAQDDKLKFSQKKQGHFPYSENALSFCIYNLFCCTSGTDCASNPNARYSAREIADNPIPVGVCGFAENRRADCDGLQYGSVRGRNPIQIPVRCAEDQGVAVQNRCAFHRLCLADIRRSAHQRIADGRFPQNFMRGKSAKATKSARAFAVFFLKYLLKSTPFQWYNNR